MAAPHVCDPRTTADLDRLAALHVAAAAADDRYLAALHEARTVRLPDRPRPVPWSRIVAATGTAKSTLQDQLATYRTRKGLAPARPGPLGPTQTPRGRPITP